MSAGTGRTKTIHGRPRLPAFNPVDTPDVADFNSWLKVVTSRKTGAYAAETLLQVRDGAVADGQTLLSDGLRSALWRAADGYIKSFVGYLKIEFTDEHIVHARAMDYFILALTNEFKPDGTPNRNFYSLRNGFFRLLTKRSIDAVRIEFRLYKKSQRAAPRQSALRSLTTRTRRALTSIDLQRLLMVETDINRSIIVALLTGDQAWRQIGAPLGLSADAARKRFERLLKYWTAKDDGDDG